MFMGSKIQLWLLLYSDKFQFMILGPSDDKCFILKINAIEIRNTTEVELLGLTIDQKLKFDAHIDKLCKTARSKLHALRRIRKFLTLEQAKLLANSFVNAQFGYAPFFNLDVYNQNLNDESK